MWNINRVVREAIEGDDRFYINYVEYKSIRILRNFWRRISFTLTMWNINYFE